MKSARSFNLNTLVTVSLLIGFAGFSLGFNYPRVQDYLERQFGSSNQQNVPQDLGYSGVEAIYDLLKDNFAGSLDANKLIEGAKEGMVAAAGDPYTVYLDSEAAQEFQEELNGSFSGVGIELAVKKDRLVAVAVIASSPAKRAGIQPGDEVAAINGQSTVEMSIDEAVSKIRGTAGTTVKLTIISGNDAPSTLTLKRQKIDVPALSSELKSKNIGYIEVSRFDEDVTQLLTTAARKLKARGATKFIIDLRNNPGGLLQEAVDMADEFLGVGKVIVEERKDGQVLRTFRSTAGGELVGLPVAVLINEGSASASEIVAGALAENDAAITVGETTFGKGSVQELIKAGSGTYLKVTVALWYTPKGQNINEKGIAPKLKAKASKKDLEAGHDPQLERALRLLQTR